MIKLTVMHLDILGTASDREDGLVIRPSKLRPAVAAKVAAKLIERGLVREVRAKDDMPIWRTDEQGKAFSLKILKAGRAAAKTQAEAGTDLQAEPPVVGRMKAADTHPHHDGVAIVARSVAPKKTRSLAPVADAPPLLLPAVSTATARQGSKREQVIALLRRPDGASMAELIVATGWLPHTTRAALSGLRKRDLALERFRDEELTTRYRITDAANNALIQDARGPRAVQESAVAAKSGSSTEAAV